MLMYKHYCATHILFRTEKCWKFLLLIDVSVCVCISIFVQIHLTLTSLIYAFVYSYMDYNVSHLQIWVKAIRFFCCCCWKHLFVQKKTERFSKKKKKEKNDLEVKVVGREQMHFTSYWNAIFSYIAINAFFVCVCLIRVDAVIPKCYFCSSFILILGTFMYTYTYEHFYGTPCSYMFCLCERKTLWQ